MNTAFFNGSFLPKEEIRISPDDRGFLFGDGVYEVMKWYAGSFFDPEGHLARLKRSLREIRVAWPESDSFIGLSEELIRINGLSGKYALVYLQVTRGAAPRNHSFPDPPVSPTVYSFARLSAPVRNDIGPGVPVMLAKDIRWSRCDIKSVSLLANTLSFQEAHEKGMKECIFVRNGIITEGSRSNIFLVSQNVLYTHPESGAILAGITRKNIIRFAIEAGISIREEPFPENSIPDLTEAFFCNSSSEITPVTNLGTHQVGDGTPGPVTREIHERFRSCIAAMKG